METKTLEKELPGKAAANLCYREQTLGKEADHQVLHARYPEDRWHLERASRPENRSRALHIKEGPGGVMKEG